METLLPILIFLAGGLLGGAAGFLAAKVLRGHDLVPRHDLEILRAEKHTLEALAEERVGKYKSDIQMKQEEARALQARNVTLSGELQAAREKNVALQAELNGRDERIGNHEADLSRIQEKMQLTFEQLSHRIFEDKATAFKTQSKEHLSELLNPLRDKLMDFHKKVDDSFGNQAKEQFALKEEIKRIVEVNEKMTLQTDTLSKALRGDSRIQGNWGEVMLEKILLDSGLRKGEDYVLQGSDLGMKHMESGQAQKPDVVVMLPDSKHIIIDSKVSLVHYERYCMDEDEIPRAEHLKQYLASVRAHVAGLEGRRYQDTDKLGTPDFVLMFMPIEGAYALAIQQDRGLHSFAWDKKIALVCPATLFAALRTIASLWRLEMQNRNAMDIAKKGGELYDKIASFADDMKKLGDQLGKADQTYQAAMGKLKDGRGNMLRKAEQLKQLGAKTSKSIPVEMILSEADDVEESSPIKLVENG